MTLKAWLTVIMHALRPESRARPRYHLVLEKEWDYDLTTFVRPYAIRAASGHSSINILDPQRIAALVPEGISSYVAGLFHVMAMNNLSDIFRYGLHPGGKYKFSRMDVHFMAFFPTDPRNEYLQHRQWRKLHIKRSKVKSNLMVLSIQPEALWREEVRLCLSNGFLLMDKVLPAEYIEAIYELEYDEEAGRWRHKLLYHHLAA
jgi:RNA:NAD 2'-phosphotransferase (TPT1/KptA family)